MGASYSPHGIPLEELEELCACGPHLAVDLRTLVDRNAAVAEIILSVTDGIYIEEHKATGSSKREPGDVFDPGLGEQFAIARAFSNLARHIHARANAEVQRRCVRH